MTERDFEALALDVLAQWLDGKYLPDDSDYTRVSLVESSAYHGTLVFEVGNSYSRQTFVLTVDAKEVP